METNRKAALVLSFIVIILIISNVVIYTYLKSQVDVLTVERNQLNDKISIFQDLANQVPSLHQQISNLSEHIRIINKQVNDLQSEKNALEYQIQILQNQNSVLQEKAGTLQSEKNKLETQIGNLSSQIATVNTIVNQQNKEINGMLLKLNEIYRINNNGIYVLNYKITYGQVGLDQTYTADITLYNALSTVTVTVKLYGSDSKLFTYTIPTGETLHRIETWKGDIWARNFDNISIENVTR